MKRKALSNKINAHIPLDDRVFLQTFQGVSELLLSHSDLLSVKTLALSWNGTGGFYITGKFISIQPAS